MSVTAEKLIITYAYPWPWHVCVCVPQTLSNCLVVLIILSMYFMYPRELSCLSPQLLKAFSHNYLRPDTPSRNWAVNYAVTVSSRVHGPTEDRGPRTPTAHHPPPLFNPRWLASLVQEKASLTTVWMQWVCIIIKKKYLCDLYNILGMTNDKRGGYMRKELTFNH